MPAKTQAAFIRSVFDASSPVPEGVGEAMGEAGQKRFNVYRNNVVVGLIDAMSDGFPLVERLVGTAFFREMAKAYVLANPPRSPLMFLYGESFADFVRNFEAANSVPYLGDVAEFEMKKRQSYFAADAKYLPLDQLDTGELMAKPYRLHPSVYHVASRYPLFGLLKKMENRELELPSEAQSVLIFRQNGVVKFEQAPPLWEAFMALCQGQNFGSMIEIFAEENGEAATARLIPVALRMGVDDE